MSSNTSSSETLGDGRGGTKKRTAAAGADAFSYLMKSARSQSKPTKTNNNKSRFTRPATRFLLCPAGCGKHFLEEKMNAHLDICIQSMNDSAPTKSQATSTAISITKQIEENTKPAAVVLSQTQASQQETRTSHIAGSQVDHCASEIPKFVSAEKPKAEVLIPQSAPSRKHDKPNAFEHLLKNSKHVFAAAADKSMAPLQHFFRMDHHHGTVHLSLLDMRQYGTHQDNGWTVSVILRNKHCRPVEVILSSSLPNNSNRNNEALSNTRLVQKHSKLSVPVLKSILQKSIRRRRPLAAVRVAMELSDKALAELLRRLPIIILEDSTLHHELGWVIWIMMAHSKGFVVTPLMIEKLLRIIYEVANCPLKDHQRGDSDVDNQDIDDDQRVHLDGMGTNVWERLGAVNSDEQLLVWAILVRAEYGGMKGDVHMLHQFARLWMSRFASGAVKKELVTQIKGCFPYGDTCHSATVTWISILKAVHSSDSNKQALSDAVADDIFEKLRIQDVCLEGIDFHCSPVIDHVLSNPSLITVCLDLMLLSGDVISTENKQDVLQARLRKLMWQYSAGLNHRKPLLLTEETPTATGGETTDHSAIWKELIEPEVRRYQLQYVKQRLV